MATATSPATDVKLVPIGDRVVVEREQVGDKTAGGIYLPESAKDRPQRGTVIAVGDGRMMESGKRSTPQVKVGDRVIFTSYGPEELKVGEQEYLLMAETDILAVIDG